MIADRLARLHEMLSQVDPTGTSLKLTESLEAHTGSSGDIHLDVRRTNGARPQADIALEALDVLRRGDPIDEDHRFALEAMVSATHPVGQDRQRMSWSLPKD